MTTEFQAMVYWQCDFLYYSNYMYLKYKLHYLWTLKIKPNAPYLYGVFAMKLVELTVQNCLLHFQESDLVSKIGAKFVIWRPLIWWNWSAIICREWFMISEQIQPRGSNIVSLWDNLSEWTQSLPESSTSTSSTSRFIFLLTLLTSFSVVALESEAGIITLS